jgi:hypothetical protein
MDSYNDIPLHSKNPYAQRRSTTESISHTSKLPRDTNLLADATNTVTNSSTAQPQSFMKLPELYANKHDDYDDDAMIDEYMEYDNDKPPDEYDSYMGEEYDEAVPSVQAVVNENTSAEHIIASSTNITSIQQSPTNHEFPIFREELVEIDEPIDAIAPVPQRAIQSRHRPRNDLYKFERYVSVRFVSLLTCTLFVTFSN